MRQANAASQQVDRYLERLPLPAQQRQEIETRVSALASGDAMQDVHRVLAAEQAGSIASLATDDNPALQSIATRLRLIWPPRGDGSSTALPLCAAPDDDGAHVAVAPPLNRRSMVPRPWGELNPFARWVDEANRKFDRRSAQRRGVPETEPGFIEDEIEQQTPPPNAASQDLPDAPDPRGYWQHSGNVRRITLLLLMLMQTALATYFMSEVLPYHGEKPLEMVILALFALLFCWVSAGFWTAMTGFLVLMRGTDPYLISREAAGPKWIAPEARTAIVMPICNEDVARVFAGLRATYESVRRSGDLERFDFFVLSDSGDADICTAEAAAWASVPSPGNGASAQWRMKGSSRMIALWPQ